MTITSRQQLDDFQAGLTGSIYKTVKVLEEAKPDLTTDPAKLTHLIFRNVELTDKYGNNVELFKRLESKADASITTDLNILCGLPSSYKHFSIDARKPLKATTASVDCILQWLEAKSIEIHADNDVLYRLLDNPKKLQALTKLQKFTFEIDQSSFQKINVDDLVDNLPALENIRIFTSSLNQAQLNGFVQWHGQMKNWMTEYSSSSIQFIKHVSDNEN